MNHQFNTPMICMPLQDSPYRCCPALVYSAAQNPCCSAPTILLTLPHIATQGEIPISSVQPYFSPLPQDQYLPTPSLQPSVRQQYVPPPSPGEALPAQTAPAPAQQPAWEPQPPLSKTAPDLPPRYNLPAYTERPASGLKTDAPHDLNNVSLKINVVPAPVQEQKPSSEPVVLVASPLKPQPVPSDVPITETHHRPRRNVKPRSCISDSPFAEPPFHSSPVEVRPGPDNFVSLSQHQPTELSDDEKERRRELAPITRKFLDNKKDCVLNVKAAHEILKKAAEIKKAGGDIDLTLAEEYALHIRNALSNIKHYNDALKVLQSRGYLQHAQTVVLPEVLLVETDLEVELQPITPGEAADLDKLVPERKRLTINPLGPIQQFTLPSPDRVYGTSFASRTRPRKNGETKDVYDYNKSRYGALKRSFDRAKDIEIDLKSKDGILLADAREKQEMLDMLKSYFDHRRNMISHYAASQ